MSLTNVQSPTYHRKMAYKRILGPSLGAFACLTLLLGLVGCEDATKKPLQAPVPALAPAKVAAAVPDLGALPLRNLALQPIVSLQAPVPGGIGYLIEKVKEKFASGEANYRAGHLEAARRDYDDAVDWMLESGYDPNSDARPRAWRRRRAPGLDLPGASGERFSAAGAFARRGPRHLAIRAVARQRVRIEAQLVGGRTTGSRKGHARGGAASARSVRSFWRLVSGHRRLQLRPRQRPEGRGAHRLRRFLGTVQTQRASPRNQELRAHHSGADFDRQGRGALRHRRGAGPAGGFRCDQAGPRHRSPPGGGNH